MHPSLSVFELVLQLKQNINKQKLYGLKAYSTVYNSALCVQYVVYTYLNLKKTSGKSILPVILLVFIDSILTSDLDSNH